MVYYKLVKITIDITSLVEVIFDIVIRNYNIQDFIISN